ncbi:MAG: AraC family transcriptional regulator [Clostridia bacterium]|nr:AraC family transcriptional regulator [Clostridia bacterium]
MKDIKLYESIPSLENNFAVKFRIYENDSALVPHWHEHIEMMFLCEGECDFHVGGRSYTATPGDLMIVNTTEIHSFTVKKHISFYSLLLFPSFFDDVKDRGLKLESLVVSDERVCELFSDMCREYTEEQKLSDVMLKSHAYALVGYLGRKYSNSNPESESPSTDLSRLARLHQVLEYIEENYSERITTKDLASSCFLSEEHFCRFFKGAVGKTVTEYINQYRVEKASVLLANTEEPIGRVGASVGFDDLNYFSRIFKKIKGCSPNKFRSQNKREPNAK